MKNTYTIGLSGEEQAEHYLIKKGMICLERRLKTKCGEIDLIMQDNDTIVFVEVKTRSSDKCGSGLNAVDYRKQKRIANGAIVYLMTKKWLDRKTRFDVIEIHGNVLLHIPNAFQPGGMMF